MKKYLTLAAVAASLALAGTFARADSLANGFNAGTGQPQDIFTVTSQNGIELGLGAQPRGASLPAVQDLGGGNYAAEPGFAPATVRAVWNFDYSIDANPTNDPSDTLTLSDLTATLQVTGPNGLNGSFDPLAAGLGNVGVGNAASTTLAQNSENMTFNLFGPPIGFDVNTPGTYNFLLTVKNTISGAITTDSINVTVAPLPSAAGMGVGMLGLTGAAALLRKKLRTA